MRRPHPNRDTCYGRRRCRSRSCHPTSKLSTAATATEASTAPNVESKFARESWRRTGLRARVSSVVVRIVISQTRCRLRKIPSSIRSTSRLTVTSLRFGAFCSCFNSHIWPQTYIARSISTHSSRHFSKFSNPRSDGAERHAALCLLVRVVVCALFTRAHERRTERARRRPACFPA